MTYLPVAVWYCIDQRVKEHPYIEVRVAEPLNSFLNVGNRA